MAAITLATAKYLSLETYRKTGVAVRTPVWFAAAADNAGKFYVYTTTEAGKTKRIRRNAAVKIAPCDMRGTLTGGWLDGTAEIVGEAEFAAGMRLLARKYWPVKQALDLFSRLFGRHVRAMLVIRTGARA